MKKITHMEDTRITYDELMEEVNKHRRCNVHNLTQQQKEFIKTCREPFIKVPYSAMAKLWERVGWGKVTSFSMCNFTNALAKEKIFENVITEREKEKAKKREATKAAKKANKPITLLCPRKPKLNPEIEDIDKLPNTKPWCMCMKCGKEKYANLDMEKLIGITVHKDYCLICGREATLIPVSDFEYASGDNSKWD